GGHPGGDGVQLLRVAAAAVHGRAGGLLERVHRHAGARGPRLMPRRRGGGGDGQGLTAEINVTSLVDVAFTLLVIFIITAPIMQGGVEVEVPRAQAENLSSPEGEVVSINREEEIYIGEAKASWEEIEPALADAVRAEQASNVYLRAD